MLTVYRVMVRFPGKKRSREVYIGYDEQEAQWYYNFFNAPGYVVKITKRRAA